ncbi:MAG: hypothetical protein EPO00_10200 [Chloroflexota bacterium]|nr:MAG: hypothetical protein EPO00_10200 [Chloroflexota bacterium]
MASLRRAAARFEPLLVVLMAAACTGAPPPPTGGPASPSPGTSAPIGPGDCPNYVDIVETGPDPTDFSENGPVVRDQGRLQGDVAAMQTYGSAHPDEFTSVRFENAPWVRLVIGFTGHIQEHCAALRSILEFPDEFQVVRLPKTATELEDIQQAIVALAGQHLRAVGIGAETIDVQLRADGIEIARQIHATYGDLRVIQVGFLPYPDPASARVDCSGIFKDVITDTTLRATARLEVTQVVTGADFRGSVTITNAGSDLVDFESGDPMTAVLYQRGTDEVVGAYEGGIGGVGTGGTLGPGGTIDIGVLGGTASCDPSLGYALPPGLYDVRVPVEQYAHPDPNGVVVTYLLSDPVPLEITP